MGWYYYDLYIIYLPVSHVVDFTPDLPSNKRGQLKFVMAGENVKSDWADYGSVTSLSFNCDRTRLLVGHSKGQVRTNLTLT